MYIKTSGCPKNGDMLEKPCHNFLTPCIKYRETHLADLTINPVYLCYCLVLIELNISRSTSHLLCRENDLNKSFYGTRRNMSSVLL